MSLAIIHTRAQYGVDAPGVTVEVHLSNGLPNFTIVGLPETSVRESKDRVRSAIINSLLDFPLQRITVNLAPADLPKGGSRFDLAIAIGILVASEQLPEHKIIAHEFVGELALSGQVRPVRGMVPAIRASQIAKRTLICSQENQREAALFNDRPPRLANTLLEICAYLQGRFELEEAKSASQPIVEYSRDLSEVKGQALARRSLELAAAGGHNLLFYGPPGTGKSMLAQRLPSILPSLSHSEAIDLAEIQSVNFASLPSNWRHRPFRSPHHTASAVSLVGGGSHPKPGEISLAHRGVLFLDELPEFPRSVLETLREPMESGKIFISRANAQLEYPANFQLVAAMNPCPCGFFGDNSGKCRCTPTQIQRYRDKVSGPLLDRIDLQVPVHRIPLRDIQQSEVSESSDIVRERVERCREIQLQRQGCSNALMSTAELEAHCQLNADSKSIINLAMQKFDLSVRAYTRIIKVARTVADLENASDISSAHLAEALGYRGIDSNNETITSSLSC